jgi:archaellum biogenesis ATPase FlaH
LITLSGTLEAVEVAVARYEFSQSEFRAALKRLAFADRENKDRLLLAVDRLRAIGAHNEFVAAAAKVAHKQLGSTG